MKTLKLIIPVLGLLLFLGAAAQDEKREEVTASVNKSFSEMYPDAVVKKWDDKKNDRYEVDFLLNDLEHKACFAADGTWLFDERTINMEDIPQATMEAFKNSRWASWRVDKLEEIKSPEHPVLYLIKVKREDNKMYLYYLPDGTLQNATSKVIF